jgi:hypothetical protein
MQFIVISSKIGLLEADKTIGGVKREQVFAMVGLVLCLGIGVLRMTIESLSITLDSRCNAAHSQRIRDYVVVHPDMF